jgi:prophage regulatory protein
MHPNTQHAPTGNDPGRAPSEMAALPATYPAPGKLLRLPVVESLTGLKRSTIYRGMRQRTFPLAVRLSARAVAWRESEVLAWCAERAKMGWANDRA